MIFGRNCIDGQELVLLGLSAENINRMKSGKPLSIGPVPGDPFLENMQIIVVCGETEADMVAALKEQGIVSPDAPLNPS